MKRYLTILMACLLLTSIQAQISPEAYRQWHADKFSMFIHFGLYSELGGVWEGQPVTNGYSEQIQSFAGIFSDWYGETAQRFDPKQFQADSIVSLARQAGMRSIVITTKHHDGFCLWNTKTTDYNTVDATPSHRDFVGELAAACRKGGIRLGLYYSIIDWHYPHAYPISSHNCDFITPQHHAFSKQQVTELLTQYGPISELWFDMGSNTPDQSRELYQLVHKLQPNCMVSGRVGNDQYDFAVMADNRYPDGALQCPWQSAASMFNETWSYRSWQERGDAHTKAMEKLRSLIEVVSHGGNYLLNIGPKGDGSIVTFEREVLQEIGHWLQQNGDAIYGTEASPFRTRHTWGNITRKNNHLYLILSGNYPTDGHITLHTPGCRLVKAEGPVSKFEQEKDEISLTILPSAYNEQTIQIVTLSFDRPVNPQPLNVISKGTLLTADNATPDYSYSCFDYYSNYRSTVAYNWNIHKNNLKRLNLLYTSQEVGKKIALTIDGKDYTIKLTDSKPVALRKGKVTWGKRTLCGPGSGLFDASSALGASLERALRKNNSWRTLDQLCDSFPTNPLESYFLKQELTAEKAMNYLVEVGAGNGIEIFVNGKSILKHLNPYRCTFRTEQVLLPLQKGKNEIIICLYNRFEKQITYLIQPAKQQTCYSQTVAVEATDKQTHTIRVRQTGLSSPHTDTELSNLRIEW